jgi:hypothetical protein
MHLPAAPDNSIKQPMPEGVFRAVRKDGTVYYRASLTCRRKHISLGSFATPEEAHKAYLEGRLILESRVGLKEYPAKDSGVTSVLPYEKWVVLVNFKTSGMYIGNPILLGQRLFYYHLSPEEVLTFDFDDLFYYSSHKIMKRGGHLFVSDYGSQIRVGARYGIKAYAVEGRDYRFLNGDRYDYRRENLDILNTYHGVERIGSSYAVKIHHKGYLPVGAYASALEAAIAYNKAIDILQSGGIGKAYLPNEPDDLSPRVYAEIYTSLEIAPGIYRLAGTEPPKRR